MGIRRRTRRHGERGSALIEAMVALTILLVGLVGMARLQYYGMHATQGARADHRDPARGRAGGRAGAAPVR